MTVAFIGTDTRASHPSQRKSPPNPSSARSPRSRRDHNLSAPLEPTSERNLEPARHPSALRTGRYRSLCRPLHRCCRIDGSLRGVPGRRNPGEERPFCGDCPCWRRRCLVSVAKFVLIGKRRCGRQLGRGSFGCYEYGVPDWRSVQLIAYGCHRNRSRSDHIFSGCRGTGICRGVVWLFVYSSKDSDFGVVRHEANQVDSTSAR